MFDKLLTSLLCVVWRFFPFRRIHFLVGEGSSIKIWKVRALPGGKVLIGADSQINTIIALEKEDAVLQVGSRSFVGGGTVSCASKITIGDDVLISWDVAIFDHGSHASSFSKRANDVINWASGHKDWSAVHVAPVHIHSKAWIGFRSIILPGVTIGEGAIVGAGSVVTHDVEAWTVVAGAPARLIRMIPEHER